MTAERDPDPMGPTDQPPDQPPSAPDDKDEEDVTRDDGTVEQLVPGVPD